MQRLLPARLLAALRPEAAERYGPPSDVLHASRRRIRFVALIGAAAYTLFLVAEALGLLGGSPLARRVAVVQEVLSLVLLGTLVTVASVSAVRDRWALGVALGVEVLLSALISVAGYWTSFLRNGHLPGITWVVPVIILFPLLVPVRPRVTLAISSLCVATMPASLALLASAGIVTVRAADYISALLAGVVGVGIASLAGRAVYRAGGQVAAARTVGSYELLELIGRGGAGEVWKARHLLLARPAAVKLILPEHLQGPREARDRALERFTREAQATADLSSPHTVRLYDFGVAAETSLYYVMELLAGANLQHLVYQHGALDPRRAVHLLQQACHSLGEAHARGLIHRDIKPSNLFLCTCGRDLDFIKVLDFGLSKPALDPHEPGLTREGVNPGTPGYMAPEQIFGMPVGPTTDLYALGCVAYWLLSGATPFESEEPGVLLRMHAQSPPPPLAERAKQPIPPRLGALVMACLAKEPADRPADADRLRAALVDSIDGPPWSAADAAAWWASRANDAAPARPAADPRVPPGDAGLQPAPGPVPRPPG